MSPKSAATIQLDFQGATARVICAYNGSVVNSRGFAVKLASTRGKMSPRTSASVRNAVIARDWTVRLLTLYDQPEPTGSRSTRCSHSVCGDPHRRLLGAVHCDLDQKCQG